ncbi:lysophospholipid transporter LplT [Parasulfuritortus cantonensis]|uniref:Lysophospholipid transporter LplT n=1 Tax=Parasulfuritortus cantonensis TaxID=2528202 RepID=A0A4R1BAG3_9PROT|nr:lysophospholipid transporter LplT [Parasulfuritortus cantonensis]TCJ13917.1 lysophospholipid transporter LplT [Parasulfuritortus cantonensis]
MDRGFYIIMAAQFFSALADNALLITAIAMLREIQAPAEYEPLLKLFFTFSYVALAAFVGAFADSMPKGRVMLISNAIKVVGCLMMIGGTNPLYAYAVVGLGAAAYSPAKYGILTEYLPHSKLVVANSWIEGLTVGAIIVGTMMGGWLISPFVQEAFHSVDKFLFGELAGSLLDYSMGAIAGLYMVAALFNLWVPDTGVDHRVLHSNPWFLLHDFAHCVKLLWLDKLGQITLAVTTLFWGAGATLQYIMLRWAEAALNIPLHEATYLQGIFAAGVAIGAVLAGKLIPIDKSVRVISVGIAMGFAALLMIPIHSLAPAAVLMVAVGAMAGFFVVPMNALLQHRGHILMGAGHSIAVQNFNENLGILIMLALYTLMVAAELSVSVVIALFGAFIIVSMYLVRRWHLYNMREHEDELERLLATAAAAHLPLHAGHGQTTGQALKSQLPQPRAVVRNTVQFIRGPGRRNRRR